VLNGLVSSAEVQRVVELVCGDGSQLALANYPTYVGFDVSPTAVDLCRERFAHDRSKTFHLYRAGCPAEPPADLALSLDVIYHLVEDDVYEQYMADLFASSRRLIAIYSSDGPAGHREVPHIVHRTFTEWVLDRCPEWVLDVHVPNPYIGAGDDDEESFASFYIYRRL
jgi:hypothetical protein